MDAADVSLDQQILNLLPEAERGLTTRYIHRICSPFARDCKEHSALEIVA